MLFATRHLLFCDMRVLCVCDASTRARVIAGSMDTRRGRGRCVAVDGWHTQVHHTHTQTPGGIGTSDAGSLVESTHTFQGGGAIGTPLRGGKYIFFNFLYGVDIILDCQILFHVICESYGFRKDI